LETTNITPKEKFNKFYNMPPNPLYKKYLDIEATKEKLRNDELNLIKLRRNEFKNSIHTMKYDSLTINHIKNQRMIFKNQTKEIYSKYKKISYRNFLINEAYNGNENAIKALESKINKDIQTSKNTFSGKFKKDIFANPNYITKEGYKVYQTGTQKIIDKDNCVKIVCDKKDDSVLLEGIKIAMKKYEALSVNGNAEFKNRVINLAVKYDLDIKFEDKALN
ncbi:hypothetical protein CFT13S00388_09435, partial [Campylobacter fetus subsp. testudinum]|uniref:LPD7 domain-containing protein n=1 Tax=Campylobacter fetus TaxID=196 RepID=UPI0008278305